VRHVCFPCVGKTALNIEKNALNAVFILFKIAPKKEKLNPVVDKDTCKFFSALNTNFLLCLTQKRMVQKKASIYDSGFYQKMSAYTAEFIFCLSKERAE
jgi:hypothetical protein